jgi:hypothetical protein
MVIGTHFSYRPNLAQVALMHYNMASCLQFLLTCIELSQSQDFQDFTLCQWSSAISALGGDQNSYHIYKIFHFSPVPFRQLHKWYSALKHSSSVSFLFPCSRMVLDPIMDCFVRTVAGYSAHAKRPSSFIRL